MKTTNPILSFFTSILFLKEYNFCEEKLLRIRKRFPYLFAFWAFCILFYWYGLPYVLVGFSEVNKILIMFLYFIVVAMFHWFFLIYVSRFVKRNHLFWLLLSPMILVFHWNLVLWNAPAYQGAMDGFANSMIIEMQLLMLVIFPTFLFALRMIKIENKIKGILLFLIIIVSATVGINNSIGKEGYLADGSGNVFVFFIVLCFAISAYLILFSNLKGNHNNQ